MLFLSYLFGTLALATNMNGVYEIGNSKSFQTDFASKGQEYFDVYSDNITSRYGEVYWTQMPDVKLPADIVARFANSTIAITGYETDQLILFPNGSETPLSINWVYNHHYVFTLLGAKAQMKLVKAAPHEMEYWMRRDGMKWQAMDTEPSDGIPNHAFFAEGNGGEMRKSYHGYPKGMAQLVASPERFSIAPMQIDTHNRDNNSTKFVVGPLPKAAQRGPPNPPYSPLLECPCTDRIYKKINHIYTSRVSNTCPSLETISDAEGCGSAISALLNVTVDAQTISNVSLPPSCFFSANSGKVQAYFNQAESPEATCGKGQYASGTVTEPTTGVSVSLTVDATKDLVTITMQGPADAWFGCGFNASIMANTPYAIIVHNASTTAMVMERKLGDHDPGTQLAPSVNIISQSVSGNVRTVVLTRPLKGKSLGYYSFDLSLDSSIPVITAVGSSQTFAYHKLRGGIPLTLLNPSGTTCVCDQGENGQLCNQMGCVEWSLTGGQSVVGPRCPPAPLSQLAEQDNPTCRLATYVGGLSCCAHLNLLLDKDQTAWPDNLLNYRIKMRFWFQDYTPATRDQAASHTDLTRLYWQTESFAGEYDVPQGSGSGLAPPAMVKQSDGSFVHSIASYFTVQQMIWDCNPETDPVHCMPNGTQGFELVVAAGHCHAPACISIELYNNDTQPPTLLCTQLPVFGTGGDRFEEPGYLALPPCLWGDASEGLLPRPRLKYSTTLLSVKKNNATYYHYGEMASWQMRGILF